MIHLPDSLRKFILPLAALGLISLLLSGCGNDPTPVVKTPPDPNAYDVFAETDQFLFRIWETRILHKEDVIDMQVHMQVINKTSEPLNMRKIGIKLVDAQGQEVQEYFQAFAPEYIVGPNDKSYAGFQCRPTLEQLSGAMMIKVGTAQKLIKDRNPLKENDLPTSFGGQKSFIAPNWQKSSSVRLLTEKEEEMNYKFKVEDAEEKKPPVP